MEQRIKEGPPIWVESLMTAEEHKECHRKYPSTVVTKEPVPYDASYHKGGKWRDGMGKGFTPDEIRSFNRGIDKLRELLQTKKFQKRPDYGPHAEAKP